MKNILFFLLIIFAFQACEISDKNDAPDVSDVLVDIEVIRFDELLLDAVKGDMANQQINQSVDAAKDDPVMERLEQIKSAYPKFYELYFDYILPIKGDDFSKNIVGFFNEESIKKLIDTTQLVFPDFNKEKEALTTAFRYFKYYFPDFEAPNIYTFISEFSHQIFLFEDQKKDGIGIGLDMLLGDDYPYVLMARDNPAFSAYLARTFNKEHIPQKVVNLLIDDRIGSTKGNRLIDHMIHNGKKLYLLDKILPHTKDHIILEYTPEQLNWVTKNELGIWSFFFDKNLFYESNMMKINKYINPSPDSPGMPSEAPGRTANYIGWKIVDAYMKKHPKTTVQQLIDIKDSQLIMDKSRYKPKRK